ncbi:PadR family transcriptional regulator [Candidatus Thorarchaeota archaeon]|nr:MAG: PadR family transcriptional regulator [Candidatus Thorarchaeota archaeon]
MKINFKFETDKLKDSNRIESFVSGKRTVTVKKSSNFEDSWKVEMRRGILQYAVLAIVKKNTEGIHGYGIARKLEERTDGLLEVKEGTLYPILHRLKKERLVNVHTEKSESGPSRKVYVLTGEGDRVYRQLTMILEDIFEKLEALKE